MIVLTKVEERSWRRTEGDFLGEEDLVAICVFSFSAIFRMENSSEVASLACSWKICLRLRGTRLLPSCLFVRYSMNFKPVESLKGDLSMLLNILAYFSGP